MASKKSTDATDAGIAKIKVAISKFQDNYGKLVDRLKELEEQKRRCDAEAIIEVLLKSGKSFNEVMIF